MLLFKGAVSPGSVGKSGSTGQGLSLQSPLADAEFIGHRVIERKLHTLEQALSVSAHAYLWKGGDALGDHFGFCQGQARALSLPIKRMPTKRRTGT